jgi:hypothetical protein
VNPETRAVADSSTLRLVCDVILCKERRWPGSDNQSEIAAFNTLLRYHGISALLETGLKNSAAQNSWPAAILALCREQALLRAVSEMANRAELGRVLQAFSAAGIRALLLKGTPLAYTHYENPILRPRGDADVLIGERSRYDAENVLDELGYSTPAGNLVFYESAWSRTDHLGVTHEIDLHWRSNNSQILAGLLDYNELIARAEQVPPLGPDAYAPAPVHALLFACIHRAGHRNAPYFVDDVAYPASERLIWFYDVHLLAGRMSRSELAELVELATRKRMKAICHESLIRSNEYFDTQIPRDILDALAPTGRLETSARYCNGGRATQMACELLALDTRSRLRWLRRTAFPPASYMREKYEDATISWLPLLYARRAAHGLWKLACPGRDGA